MSRQLGWLFLVALALALFFILAGCTADNALHLGKWKGDW